MTRASLVRLLVLALLAAACATAVIFFDPLKQLLVDFLAWLRGLGDGGLVLLAAVYVVACVLFVPGSILTLGAGAVFGLVKGFIAVSVGSVLGAAAAFLVGRTVARGWVERKVAGSPRFRAIDRAVGANGFQIVLLTRLSPLFPFNLLNYAFGLTRVPLGTYILASWIGMVPGTLMYVYLGTAIGDLARLSAGGAADEGGTLRTVLFYVGLAAAVVVTVVITRIARKALRQAVCEEGPARLAGPTEVSAASRAAPLAPADAANDELVRNVHPPDWVNPEPAPRYNLVVIGAGTAGLVTAAGAAGLGAKVALVERHLMGGDCLIAGCVPSKALLRAARAWAEVRDAGAFGVEVPPGARVNFPAVMERMRRLRASLSPTDSAARFRGLGVDVFFGSARFAGPDTVEVAGRTLHFRKAVIATGTRPRRPDVPGLDEIGYLTNETVFFLTELPARLAVIGAGPVGCELAQAFARFGAAVTLVGNQPQVLPREDADAAGRVARSLERDGVRLLLGAKVMAAGRRGADKFVHVEAAGGSTELLVDDILAGVGRSPNVEGLNLGAAGVDYDPDKGVHVNDRLRTSNRRIYAAGDVCSPSKFTHAADALARIVIRNALFLGRARVSALVIPWCTYTDPEVARVGLNEQEARQQGVVVQTFVQELRHVDRAVLDGAPEGMVKLLVRKGTGRLVGATVVAPHAGEMIGELTLALAGRLGLGTLANTILPYPTQAEAIKKGGDAYQRTRLTPLVRWLTGKWLDWTR